MASPPALSRREGAGSRKGFLLFFISLSVLQLPLYGRGSWRGRSLKKNDDWAIRVLSTNHHPLFYHVILNNESNLRLLASVLDICDSVVKLFYNIHNVYLMIVSYQDFSFAARLFVDRSNCFLQVVPTMIFRTILCYEVTFVNTSKSLKV